MGDNTNPEDFITEANAGAQWRLGDFDALRFVNTIVIPEQKELDIIIAVQQEHIPSRIYEQLQSMNKYYEDVLINFDIFNLSHNKRRLRVEAEIDGYTSADKRVVFIHGLNSNRKARQQVSLCPRMKRGALISLINPQRATLLAKVFDENTRELILDKTFPVTILPSDQMVWSLRSIKNSKTFNLSKFIASWIYPKDQEGQFDAVRTGAVKYHPNGQCYYDGTSKSLLEHAKAVYEYLSRDVGMVYVHQPFNASRQFDAQRVVLPEQSLKNRAGNCADLTVLMASILEGFGIQSLIFITKDHVFIGWGNPKSIKTMVALEMTLVGQASFEEAMVAGQENIKKYYLMTGAQDIMPMNFMSMARDAWIISLAECRSEGIVGSKQS